jgi:hypothetical protein
MGGTISTVRRKLPLLLGAFALSAASACGGSQQNSLSGKSPGSVLSTALSAAAKFQAVHYVLQTTSNGQTQTVTGDAATSNGAQSVVLGTDQTVVVVVGATAYLRGNAGGLQDIIGFSSTQASQEGGKWISFQKGDAPYQTVVQGVTLNSLLSELKPVPPLIESSPGTVSGVQVVGVRGGLQSSPRQGEATFWVATAAPNVLVSIDARATSVSTGKTVTQVGVFSKWGARFRVTAPSGSVPFSSLQAK